MPPRRTAKPLRKNTKAAPQPLARKAAPPAPEPQPLRARPYPIVGIGASAGGLEAFHELLHALPRDTGMAFVLVQHLDPDHESILARLLAKATSLPVNEVKDGVIVEPNHVYVIPPNATMAILHGVLHLMARDEPLARHLPIDFFLRSLAEDQGSRAIGVILSGTASDGTLGLKAVKAEGGITFAQDESAKYDGMPRSAIAAGCVDFVLPPEKIAHELARLGKHPYVGRPRAKEAGHLVEGEDHFRRLFLLLRTATGVDFTHYKPAGIKRRIARRMAVHKMESLPEYVRHVLTHRDEMEALYQDFFIHVTSFFREPASFEALQKKIFPRLLKQQAPGQPLRFWVPGCSTGEEAYSLAIALAEKLREPAIPTALQIFGTDISDSAIQKARTGLYPETSVAEVSPARLRRFFVKVAGGYQIIKSIREMCIFARQDLIKDAPFPKLDLISCRNVLIYMDAPLQKKLLGIFHYALKPAGFLMLGGSESISGSPDLFEILDQKNKIYSRKFSDLHPAFALTAMDDRALPASLKSAAPEARFDVQKEADRMVLGRYGPPGLIVTESLQVLHFRGQCSPYPSPSPGTASLSLVKMVRPELVVDLRNALHRAKTQNGPVRKEGIALKRNGSLRIVNLEVLPIRGPDASDRQFLVLFEDHPVRRTGPAAKRAGAPPKPSKKQQSEIAILRRELRTTKEYLHSVVEDQEAINEELKSANEEALSSNEELQSTNEELETAKEELQSTNEELVTVNEQMQNRNAELGQLSGDLTNVLGGVNIPILMLDNQRRVRSFTPPAEKLLNLRAADVGRPVHDLRLKLEIPNLDQLISNVMDTITVHEQEVRDARGQWYSLRVRPYKTLDNRIDGVMLIFIDIDVLKQNQEALRDQDEFSSAVLDTVGTLVMVLDPDGHIVRFNRACQELSGYSLEQAQGKPPWDFLVPSEQVEDVKSVHRQLLGGAQLLPGQNTWITRDGRRRLISWTNSALRGAGGAVKFVIRSGIDTTDRQAAEDALRGSESALRESQLDLRALSGGLLNAQDEERKRIARELHDDLNQQLAFLGIEMEKLGQQPSASRAAIRAKLRWLQDQMAELADRLHRTAYQLHPSVLEHVGLEEALQSYCADFSKHEAIQVQFTARELPAQIPPNIALCVYRVVQEALRNVAKHSGASEAQVALSASPDALRLEVRDPGRGFDTKLARGKGLGLISMEERVRLAGGTLSIETVPGDGVSLAAEIPLPH